MRCSSSRTATEPGANNGAQVAHHRHQPGRPGAGRGAAVHLAVGRRIRAGADADRRRQQPAATTGKRPSRRRCATPRRRSASSATSSMPPPTASWCSTATARCMSVNRGAEKLFGYQSRELTGLPFAEPVRAGKPARRARISRQRRASRRRQHADGREVIGRAPRGRPDPAVHDDRPDRRRRRQALRHVPRHHAVEEDRGRTCSTPSARRKRRPRRNPISSPRSATRSARRSTPSSAFPR